MEPQKRSIRTELVYIGRAQNLMQRRHHNSVKGAARSHQGKTHANSKVSETLTVYAT